MRKIFLILIFLVTFGSLYAYESDFYEIIRATSGVTTLAQMRDFVRAEVEDVENLYNTNRFTNGELDDYINIIHQEVAILTSCLHSRCTGQLTAGATSYYLPENLLAIERVIYNNELLPEISPYDLDVDDPQWFTAEVSSPTAYYRFPGDETINFYPCPEYSNGLTEIWYIKAPNILVADGDEIFDSILKMNIFRRTLVRGTAALIFNQVNDPRSAGTYQEYVNYIELIKKYYDMRPNYKPNIRIYKKKKR